MFYKYLNNQAFISNMDHSTYQASTRKNIKKIYSVESDVTWQNKLKHLLTTDNKDNFCYGKTGKNIQLIILILIFYLPK